MDGGNNLSSDSSCNFTNTGSLNAIDPGLGPLGDYGGPTPTMPLLSGSPAIDGGGNVLARPPTNADTRGPTAQPATLVRSNHHHHSSSADAYPALPSKTT